MSASVSSQAWDLDNAPPRWETQAAMDHVNALLHLKEEEWMQDRDILLADPKRLAEFIAVYEATELDRESRFALMRLIVASLDDWLASHGTTDDADVVPRVERLLCRDFLLHLHTVDYWRLADESDPENIFHVTPVLRRVWQDCYREVYGRWLDDPLLDEEAGSQAV